MKRLTEEMVIARTKISDMTKVKRLNCWGSELADVSLLRRMPNVEVLSLSINKIGGLADFEHCRQLQELYVRQNEIWDLSQVCYLQNLTNLKHLWLGENPCANVEGYRLAVIRALPQLQKLDNVIIQPEELSDALKKGSNLVHPDDESEQEQYVEAPHYEQTSGYRSPQDYNEQEVQHDQEDPGDFYENDDTRELDSPIMQDYSNGDKHYHPYRQHEGSGEFNSGAYEPPRREQIDKNSCPVNHRAPFNRRPVTRNSNILSAVLCLVKELDYPSLEVVEMAVRCRMDELNE